jgi:hypothetical protein
MAALFSASVRAPLTGIVLTVEMTGRGDLTLSLLGASLMAMVVAMLLKSEPIYETLKRRMLGQEGSSHQTVLAMDSASGRCARMPLRPSDHIRWSLAEPGGRYR